LKLIEFVLKDGMFRKVVKFSEKINIIYSKKNSVGKTTFLRAIFYALGYQVPSTRGIKFDRMEFWLTIDNNNKQFKLYRHDSYLSVDDGTKQIDYSLPTDWYEVHSLLTGCNNEDVLDNLLGASYMDQEKGWTLLNRGKVIGNIHFNIEALVRGLGGKTCSDELLQLEAVKRQLKKYECMHSVAEYQEEIYEKGEDIEYDASDEEIDRQIEILKSEKKPILDELKQIKSILRKNKLLAEYIADMKLMVQTPMGDEIPVTQETLVGFRDNIELLSARREMLAASIDGINRKIASFEKQKEKDNQLFKVQTAIEAFDSDIKKISVDAIATQRIIDQLKSERKKLQKRIRAMTKQDNDVVEELYDCISVYAKKFDISETYIASNKDYIFTNDLKSLTGTILHKVVLAFKLAYIRLIKEKSGIILPIVLDSPAGREVEFDTVEKMLQIIQRDYPEHQLIIASIYDYNLNNKTMIEFQDRLFRVADIMDSATDE